MRQIKFRGLRWYGGQYHYMYGGYNKRVNGEECIIESGVPHVIRHGNAEQLIGVDANGCEVYEGDDVQYGGLIHKATFEHYRVIKNGEAVKCE